MYISLCIFSRHPYMKKSRLRIINNRTSYYFPILLPELAYKTSLQPCIYHIRKVINPHLLHDNRKSKYYFIFLFLHDLQPSLVPPQPQLQPPSFPLFQRYRRTKKTATPNNVKTIKSAIIFPSARTVQCTAFTTISGDLL